VKIVRERADAPDNHLRIPALLELQTLPLDHTAGEEILDVDGERHVAIIQAWRLWDSVSGRQSKLRAGWT
jgi:hypothetical protein